LQRHHVLDRSLLKRNKKAIFLVERTYRKIFIQWVCAGHNCSKYADTQRGRAWLLARFPGPVVREALEEIQACYKGGYPKLNYLGLMAGMYKEAKDERKNN
jgi:nitrate reductase alpha subunit